MYTTVRFTNGDSENIKAGGLVKRAKAIYESAIQLDGKALDGSAYNSLGVLYYKVPGWPVGFGDKKRAKELLEQALALNPKGIDPNFFYGEYLENARVTLEGTDREAFTDSLGQYLDENPADGRRRMVVPGGGGRAAVPGPARPGAGRPRRGAV